MKQVDLLLQGAEEVLIVAKDRSWGLGLSLIKLRVFFSRRQALPLLPPAAVCVRSLALDRGHAAPPGPSSLSTAPCKLTSRPPLLTILRTIL